MAQSDITYDKVGIDDVQESGNPDPISMLKSLLGSNNNNSNNNDDLAARSGTPTPPAAAPPSPGAKEPTTRREAQMAALSAASEPADDDLEAGEGVQLRPIPQLAALQNRYANLTGEQKREAEAHASRMQAMIDAKLAQMTPEERAVFEKKQALMTKAVMAQMQGGGGAGGAGPAINLPTMPQESAEDAKHRKLLFAVRSGNLPELQELLGEYKVDLNFSVRAAKDPETHPLLHWAALNDQVEVLKYMIDSDVNLDQRNPRGEVALHWAALNGNVRTVHLLIEAGCDRTASDARGYSAMHHAAQFGRSLVLAFLLRRGLNVDLRDNNGRTALHWAAYKGEDICAQWLLDHGADVAAEDFEQCLPIHWAALQGLYSTAAVLIKNGSLQHLGRKDRTGGTPAALAREKQDRYAAGTLNFKMYQHVADYLEECERRKQDVSKVNRKRRHITWYTWPVMAPLGFWLYYTVVMPHTYFYPTLTFLFWFFYWSEWVAWIMLQMKDPGNYVIRNSNRLGGANSGNKDARVRIPQDEAALDDECVSAVNPKVPDARQYRQMYLEVLDRGLLVPVCTTCEIVKPLRSKHDRFTDVCVARFDHYCPFMGVAIGADNYREFFFSMFNAMWCMWLWLYMVILYTFSYDKSASYWSNFSATLWFQMVAWLYLPIALYATLMVSQHMLFIKRNITTNEVMNRTRYRYLARRQNPFDRGLLSNVLEFLGMHDPVKLDVRRYYEFHFAGRSEEVEENNESMQRAGSQAGTGPMVLESGGRSNFGQGFGGSGYGRSLGGGHGHSHGGEPCGGHGHSHNH